MCKYKVGDVIAHIDNLNTKYKVLNIAKYMYLGRVFVLPNGVTKGPSLVLPINYVNNTFVYSVIVDFNNELKDIIKE